MLGCVAAVKAMLSPSQLRPAVSQRMSISSMGVAVCTVCYRAYCIQSPIETIPVEVRSNERLRFNRQPVRAELGESNMRLSKVLTMLVVATVVAGVIASIPDIKRYIRISTM